METNVEVIQIDGKWRLKDPTTGMIGSIWFSDIDNKFHGDLQGIPKDAFYSYSGVDETTTKLNFLDCIQHYKNGQYYPE